MLSRKGEHMNVSVIRYHYLIRILGVLAILVLIGFSEYHQHMGLLYGIVIFLYHLYDIGTTENWYFQAR
jgi:hypothetical protein